MKNIKTTFTHKKGKSERTKLEDCFGRAAKAFNELKEFN